ncbi:response regulator [Shewanella youngdeokensis]|uniref:histidine kinase n=1 Tax=Shewanella youngdeokensis TaxID=2999068 RepID=A0ABZ0JZD9_9GAMM|nr:response regulator [Shewanella sp. DAU334]
MLHFFQGRLEGIFTVAVDALLVVALTVAFHATAETTGALNSPIADMGSTDLTSVPPNNLALELKDLDKSLSLSLRNYALSGNNKWLTQYQSLTSEFNDLLHRLQATPQGQNSAMATLKLASQPVSKLEQRVIELMSTGNNAGAIAILNSQEYQHHKGHYLKYLLAPSNTVKPQVSTNLAPNATKYPPVFTDAEQAWVQSNTVRIGFENSPPLLMANSNGSVGGITGDIVNQVITQTGLKTALVIDSWDNLTAKFKQGEIDLLPHRDISEPLKKLGYFSTPYFVVQDAFFIRKDHPEFNNRIDLSYAKIAINKHYAKLQTIKSQFPHIRVIETAGLAESVDLVLTGEADALLDISAVVDDWLTRHNISQLSAINESVLLPATLHLFSHVEQPILASILQKGLDSIQLNDITPPPPPTVTATENATLSDAHISITDSMWIVIGFVAALLIVASFSTSTVLSANDKSLVKMFGSNRFKRSVFVGLVALTAFLITAACVVMGYAEQQSKDAIEYNLNTRLNSTHERMSAWVDTELTLLERVGKNSELTALVEQLLQEPRTRDALLQSPLQAQLREFFSANQGRQASFGFFIISPDHINLSSRRDTNIGDINVIYHQRPDLIAQVLAGHSVFVPPIHSDVYFNGSQNESQKAKPPTMFFAAPILDQQKQIIAILTKRVKFDGMFSTILSAGFVGRSSETYAIDNQGLLLSNVRFEDDLKQIGLINDNQSSSLNLRIADPGTNLIGMKQQADPSWPLTYMAQQLVNKQSGSNLTGYRDYRGSPVLGSWVWNDLLGVGLVAEVDIREAFSLLETFKYSVWSLLTLSLVLLIGSTLFTLRIGTRATRALVNARIELEALVKERTAELQVNMQRTQAIIDNASDGIIMVNDHGLIQEFSPAAESIFGYQKRELLGTNITALMDLPFHDQYTMAMAKSQSDNVLLELQGHCKNTTEIDIEVAVSETRLAQEIMYTAIVRDATLRKEAERELTSAKLKAEEATKAKSDFLANMSHEIRTPMNAIIGMSYLAMQTDLNRKQAGYVGKIQTSAELLLGIINDILDFSKIEAGKLDLEQIDFNLNDSIDNLVHIISQKSQQKEIELLVDIAPNLPVNLIGDPLRLGQILINLANNAIKFTDSGEIIISAELVEMIGQEAVIKFSVKDTGIGMTEAQLGRLFKSFSQADASTTRKYGGTGLGLTISKTLTELMQGRIWVESDYGKGSTFNFTAQFGVGTAANETANYHTRNLAGLPLLIVDDSTAAREILYTLSQSLGFAPDLASSGQEALTKLTQAEQQGAPFKLVISDWKMPHMTGLELGQAIMGSDQLSTPPKFVLMTAYDRDEMLKLSKNIKIDSSLTKPVSISTLLDTVLKVMNNQSIKQKNNHDGKLDFSSTKHISGAHILLVEDNDINQEVAIELLTLAGLKVSSAWNGLEAVEKVANEQFDAVLMDMQMPVMDGYEATRIIRQDPKNTDLPIIAMTANAMSGDKEKCIAAGMNDHLRKPIDPQLVFRTLAHWVSISDEALTINSKNATANEAFNIEGFDTKNAIARMAGNLKAYKKTLLRVVNDEADSITRIKTALEADDLKTAVLIAHTIKGIAGSIGATALVTPTEALELLLGQHLSRNETGHSAEVNALIAESEQQLQQMITAINSAMDASSLAPNQTDKTQDAAPQNTAAVTKADISPLIETLKEQIDNYNSAVTDTFDELTTELQLPPTQGVAANIGQALAQYDFETAAALLPEFIDFALQQTQSTANTTPISAAELTTKLDAILSQVHMFDSAAADSVDALLELNLTTSMTTDLTKLADSLSRYDFDEGEALIRLIKSKL